jgi:hypothetical protein
VNSLGTGPCFWHGIDFCEHAPTPKVSEGDGNSYNSTWFQFNHEFLGSYPANKINVMQFCRFGRQGNGLSTGYTIGACRFDNASIVEDCIFWGVSFGVGGRTTTARRNRADMVVEDFRRIGFSADTPITAWAYGNEVYRRDNDPMWDGNHADGFQIGSTATTAKVTIYLLYNLVYDSALGIQGMAYCDDSDEAINGVIANCLYIGVHVRALQTRRPEDMLMINNTILAPPNGVDLGASLPQIKVELLTDPAPPVGPHVLSIDNLVVKESEIPEEIGMSYGTLVIPHTGDGYAAVMTGPFTGGSGAPVWADWDSLATLEMDDAKALIDAMVVTIGGGVGKGHLATPNLDFPAIKEFAATTGATPSTATSCGQKRVHRGSGLAVSITGSTAEFRVLDSDGSTVLRDWGTGATTVDKGHLVEPRITASATLLATVSGTLTVDGVGFDFSVQTAAIPSEFWTVADGSPRTFAKDPANLAAGTTLLDFNFKFLMPSAPSSAFALIGQSTTALKFEITTARKLTIQVKDSATNAVFTAAKTLKDSLGNDVVLPFGEWVDFAGVIDHTGQIVAVTINGVAHPDLPFDTPGTGSQRSGTPIMLGSEATSGTVVWPAGTQVADVSIYRNGVLHVALPNDATSLNADAWQAGADAT